MRLTPKIFYTYLAFLISYAALVLIPKPLPAVLARYNISATELRIIDVTIVILLAIIWYAGFFGYDRLRSYANLIGKDKDGQQIAKLSKGLLFIVLWLPLSETLSALLKLVASKHPGLLPAVTIIDNYVSLILPLIGFIFIGSAAFGLSSFIRGRPSYKVIQALVLFLIYVGLVYLHLIFSTEQRSQVYHLSIWLISLTLAGPYIYMWFIGIIAAYEIYRYQNKVAGIVYKRSWSLLALGVGWLIISSIIFQFVTTLSARLQNLSIYLILIIVYTLLLVLSVGFVLIALGARKLQRIEEV